jgi:addiction module HigA family antidote
VSLEIDARPVPLSQGGDLPVCVIRRRPRLTDVPKLLSLKSNAPMTKIDRLPPVHPGQVLREEYLAPLGITPYALAAALRLSRTHVESLVREEISLTASTALRLAGYFGTSREFWLGIQARFDKRAMKLATVLTQLATRPTMPGLQMRAAPRKRLADKPPKGDHSCDVSPISWLKRSKGAISTNPGSGPRGKRDTRDVSRGGT